MERESTRLPPDRGPGARDVTFIPGTEVDARGLRWEVVLAEQLGGQTLYRLRGVEAAVRGVEVDILSPFEDVSPIISELDPARAASLPTWLVYHQAFLLDQAVGPHALLAVQPGRLRLEPYQLVPVIRALSMSRARLLLADGVGLGKTVQAGLVLTELMARRLAHRVLIISPAGPLLEQWKTEMLERFGLRLDVIDRGRLDEIRRQNELGDNPFDHIPLGLTSIDFLKQERVLEQVERASYDVVVIDEAHHCTDPGRAAEWEDSQRRRLATVLAGRCDSLLLLTATPHDGYDRSFASLLELLDPSLVDAQGQIRGTRYRANVIRRLKPHIKDPATGEPRFKERIVEPRPVDASASQHSHFIELQRRLLELIAPELRRAFRARRYNDVLAFIALLKRSVSTVRACGTTLSAVADRLSRLLSEQAEADDSRRQRLRSLREYQRKLQRFGALSPEEEEEQAMLEAEDIAQQLASLQRDLRSGSRRLARLAGVTEALDELGELAAKAEREDPKLAQLVAEVSDIRERAPRANVLVYTEYADSQRAASESLRTAGVGTVLTLSGDDNDAARSRTTDQFRTQDNLVLVSTDAAAEGLNLHQRCHHLIHLELPWNPNRLEQRNGRIDRYGQTQNPIVRYLFLRKTFEERILLRLIAKYENQRSKLTFVPNTLGVTSAEATSAKLLGGLIEEEGRLFKGEEPLFNFSNPDAEDSEGPAVRELLEEVDRSLKSYEQAARTNAWLAQTGVNAEESRLKDADEARRRGDEIATVDLVSFVRDAVYLDGGDWEERDGVLEIVLPSQWSHGLEDLPGYDGETRRLRLTTDIERMHDDEGRSVGYLGRAHPLVQRALDRVRNIRFGADARGGLDKRVSAVSAPVTKPELLLTYLGRIISGAGREYERVLAVRMGRRAIVGTYTSAADWLPIADRAKAIPTAGVWEKYFAAVFDPDHPLACAAAMGSFVLLADDFVTQHRRALEQERRRNEEWLRERADEIIGGAELEARQLELGEAVQPSRRTTAKRPGTPEERLAELAGSARVSPSKRGEAETVLRLYRQRTADLQARLSLGEPEVVPLGLLMLVPEGKHGA